MGNISASLPAGETVAEVSVAIVNDAEQEQVRESFEINLSVAARNGLTLGTTAVTVDILDDDGTYNIIMINSSCSDCTE